MVSGIRTCVPSSADNYAVAIDARREFGIRLKGSPDTLERNGVIQQVREALEALLSNATTAASKIKRIEGYLTRLQEPPVTAEWPQALTGLVGSYSALYDAVKGVRKVGECFSAPVTALDHQEAYRGREKVAIQEYIEQWLEDPSKPLEIPAFPTVQNFDVPRPYMIHELYIRNTLKKASQEQLIKIIEALVKSCPNLEELDLGFCKVTPEAILLLAPLQKLQKVTLASEIRVTHIMALAHLPALRDVKLYACDKLDDQCLQAVSTLPHLKQLSLECSTGFTDAGLAPLIQMGLTRFAMNRCNREALSYVSKMTTLQELTLSDYAYRREGRVNGGFEQLDRLVEMRVLSIEAKGLRSLEFAASMPKLRSFYCGSESLSSLHGLRTCTGLEELSLGSPRVTDEELASIADLTNIRTLTLPHGITSAGLQHLARLTEMRELRLPNRTTNDGLRAIAHMTRLEKLSTQEHCHEIGHITSAGLVHLAQMEKMQDLSLPHQSIDDEGLQHLTKMKDLKKLNFRKCIEITGSGFVHFAEIGLETFDLSHCKKLLPQSLAHLRHMIHMRKLNLGFCENMASGLEHLEEMREMQMLGLVHCGLKDEDMQKLSHMTKMESLDIIGNSIRLPGVQALRSMKELLQLNMDASIPIQQDFIECLMEFHSLRSMRYWGTHHSADRKELEKTLPRLRI